MKSLYEDFVIQEEYPQKVSLLNALRAGGLEALNAREVDLKQIADDYNQPTTKNLVSSGDLTIDKLLRLISNAALFSMKYAPSTSMPMDVYYNTIKHYTGKDPVGYLKDATYRSPMARRHRWPKPDVEFPTESEAELTRRMMMGGLLAP